MSALTVKNIPDDLLQCLRLEAAASHRSLNGEILMRLKKSLESTDAGYGPSLREEAAIQADAWEKLSGRWVSDASIEEEIESLYAARSPGRDTDLTW